MTKPEVQSTATSLVSFELRHYFVIRHSTFVIYA